MLENRKLRAVAALICCAAVCAFQSASAQNGIAAITSPSADTTLSFVQSGRIVQVSSVEGALVTPGQVLVRLDDAVEQVRLKMLKARSENRSQLEASQATLDQKRIDHEKLEWALERGASTVQEVAHAALDAKIAELGLEIAEFEHQQNIREYAAERLRVEAMALKSPIAGRVEEIEVEVGESVSSSAPVIRVVRIDPLWIDVHVTLQQAMTLELGQTAQVLFPDEAGNPVSGTITFIGAVADAGSSTLRTRLEVPNESNRPAGQHVTIVFQKMSE